MLARPPGWSILVPSTWYPVPSWLCGAGTLARFFPSSWLPWSIKVHPDRPRLAELPKPARYAAFPDRALGGKRTAAAEAVPSYRLMSARLKVVPFPVAVPMESWDWRVTQNPKEDESVESHVSQRTRDMGHPAVFFRNDRAHHARRILHTTRWWGLGPLSWDRHLSLFSARLLRFLGPSVQHTF